MSECLSWIHQGKKTYYLTHDQVFHTKKGRALMEKLKGDFIGHSAIRFYYRLPEPDDENRRQEPQCTDFSTPDNFPAVLVEAIQRGDFRGFGTPECLLSAPAL